MDNLRAVAIDGTVIEADKIKPEKQGLELMAKHNNQPETIGFIPYDRLMYVIPQEVTHQIEQLDETPI